MSTNRVSTTQLEILVSFMEQHGDLSRPSDGANGRSTNSKNWTTLVSALNGDLTGCSKTEEKWRRTWSDLKNNIKKKVAKINKGSTGTGGGPACTIKLTALDERVLAIMNPQAATGMINIVEMGITQDNIHNTDESAHACNTVQEDLNIAQFCSSPVEETEIVIEPYSINNPTTLASPIAPRISPRRRHRQNSPLMTRPSQLERRRRQTSNLTQAEMARQAFIESDREWRRYQIQKETQQHELESERLRLREIELAQQAKWQELFCQLLKLAENFVASLEAGKKD